jgi:hypothetical protein
MKTHIEVDVFLKAAGIGIPLLFAAHAAVAAPLPKVTEQEEADYRVIAARCGTPAFEKAFMKQSMAAVSAGLVSSGRHSTPADTEKAITALRRSPFVLVAASADCKEQLARLAELQKSRSGVVKSARSSVVRK